MLLVHAERAKRRIARLGEGALERAEAALSRVRWFDPADVASFLVSSPFHAAVALSALDDRPHSLVGERLAELFPELAGLAVPDRAVTHEHSVEAILGRASPLVDHVLRALSHVDDVDKGLDERFRALIVTTLLFADVAKGGSAALRADWLERLGVDGAVHNQDSAVVLSDVMRRVLHLASPFREDARFVARAEALVATTGAVGMHLRGEVGFSAFAPLSQLLARDEERAALAACWSIVNRCDTSAVREGLWTDELARAFEDVEARVLRDGALPAQRLEERIARFRHGAVPPREAIEEAEAALARLGPARAPTEARMEACNVWYAEAALGPLSLDGAVRLVALLAASASRVLDTASLWHLDLLEVAHELRDDCGAPRTYPVRLLETLLATTAPEDLASGRLRADALVSFPAKKGGVDAALVRLEAGEEARALLTLLPIYERKQTAAFHATLKALCDLYGLRKDDFDRVANEVDYLRTMNAARSDKARMVDLAVPGLIVEVGPGGGVVLDLLESRFPSGRIVGLDASIAVVEALGERLRNERHRWEIVHGDAFRLPELFPGRDVTTVVFCSVLHEIFSYVPWSDEPGKPPRRFSLGSVDALVAATFRALAPGGRIVVRDGVMPPREPRWVEILDPSWREGLELFARSWEARAVTYETLADGRVRIDAPDLLELITTFTWGPAAFPYEIREQRAVLPRDEWVARLLRVCEDGDPPHRAREVPVPRDLASYLQPGYPAGIEGKLRIFDERGREVPMPDVTGVFAIEKSPT